MSRKLRWIRRLERHLRKHPNDRVAREILQALKEGRYRWKGRSIEILPPGSEQQSAVQASGSQ